MAVRILREESNIHDRWPRQVRRTSVAANADF